MLGGIELETSIIGRFQHKVATRYQCSGCGYERTRSDNEYVQTVALPAGGFENTSEITLQDLLGLHTGTEPARYDCEECADGNLNRQSVLESLPQILVIALKRFDNLGRRNTQTVYIPLEMDADTWTHFEEVREEDGGESSQIEALAYVPTVGGSKRALEDGSEPAHKRRRLGTENVQSLSREDTNAESVYQLVGLVHHYGKKIRSGHYTASAWMGECWMLQDDNRVTESDTIVQASKTAYLLFYTKKV